MTFLDEVREDRQSLADVLKKHRGIRRMVEDLYPDRAHFIYELLQNAEDVHATEASFALKADSVSLEHDGRPFSKENVWGITDIGEGTKAGNGDEIGRFGIGFKAVFAYSEVPHIWSGPFSFKIRDLVLPEAITAKPDLGNRTRFEFPFNSPKKTPHDAYQEVEAGLTELAETTLLFLTYLKSIRWEIDGTTTGEVRRLQHSENHMEVRKLVCGKPTGCSHFLRFADPVRGLESQRVAVAFALAALPDISAFDPAQELAKQFKIASATPGRVAISFPAEKEASGLRFHLHAPFVPELSRASVKEAPANRPLFDQLATVASASLHRIRDANLLTGEFLAVLPNSHDEIPSRYEPIRSAIIEEMDERPLTPTYSKSHIPAKQLLQSKATLKDLLSAEDLALLKEGPRQWAIAATQRNSNADRFLQDLAIEQWDVSSFVRSMRDKWYADLDNPQPQFLAWLASKPMEWHQQMYALLWGELTAYRRKPEFEHLIQLPIVRLANGKYEVGSKCYFPGGEVEFDDVLPRVEVAVYSSGKALEQQQNARKLLVELNVREVDETEVIKTILNQRYRPVALNPNLKDLERFVRLVETDRQQAAIFKQYHIFMKADRKWGPPSQVYLDAPYGETGLSAFYEALGARSTKAPLSDAYLRCAVSRERLRRFAECIGVQNALEIKQVSCGLNPAARDLLNATGKRTAWGIDRDYTIEDLKGLLPQKSEALSRLVWITLYTSKADWLHAEFSPNRSQAPVRKASQLVCMLREAAWIPQTDGRFVRPSSPLKYSRTPKTPRKNPLKNEVVCSGFEYFNGLLAKLLESCCLEDSRLMLVMRGTRQSVLARKHVCDRRGIVRSRPRQRNWDSPIRRLLRGHRHSRPFPLRIRSAYWPSFNGGNGLNYRRTSPLTPTVEPNVWRSRQLTR